MFSREGYENFLKSKGTSASKERACSLINTHPGVKKAQKIYKEAHNGINPDASEKSGFKKKKVIKDTPV